MQVNKNSSIDTRTFPEIWASLGTSSPEQLMLRDVLIEKLHITRQSVNNWGLGKTCPISEYLKKRACTVINNHLGINTVFRTLFPGR